MSKTTVHPVVTTGGDEEPVVVQFPPTNTTTVHPVTTTRDGDAQTVIVKPVE